MSIQEGIKTLTDFVVNWVHFDNLAATLSRQIQQARTAKTRWETEILSELKRRNMENAIIQISGARLTVHNEKHTNPLTLTRLEELLHQYYSKKPPGSTNETAAIIEYVRENRLYTVKTNLKKN